MKFQYLAVIFLVILLPISVVVTYYIQFQVDTLNTQIAYDERLLNATHDSVKAFQLNTFNNTTSDVVNSKLGNIKAAANTFFTSVSSNFNVSGYNADTLRDYVPALVFTMYDGFYIYSRYDNIVELKSKTGTDAVGKDIVISESNKKIEDGLKPYIYYSCRYKRGTDDDFIITYSLDNYITIQGTIKGNAVNESGYIINPENVDTSNGTVKYRETEIKNEDALIENYGKDSYKYIKLNGTHYYLDEKKDAGKDDDKNGEIFYILNGKRVVQCTNANNSTEYQAYKDKIYANNSAVLYYKNAREFSKRVLDTYGLKDLTWGDAYIVDENGNEQSLMNVINEQEENSTRLTQTAYKIFDGDIEASESNFNMQRKDVIRYVIQSNLTIAIANYNDGASEKNFSMPKLTDEEWDTIINNISVISFLQSMPIGGKIYNGHAIVANNLNNEYVGYNSIYISDGTENGKGGTYYRANDKNLEDKTGNLKGYLNIDFQKTTYKDNSSSYYYLPRNELGSYSSIVNSYAVVGESDIFRYITKKATNLKVKEAYYTALGRERYGAYKLGDKYKPSNLVKE